MNLRTRGGRPGALLSLRRRREALAPGLAARLSGLLGLALVLGLTAVLSAPLFTGAEAFEANRPSPRTVEAPRTVSFVSRVGTEAAAARAAESVPLVFVPVDGTVAVRQEQRARDVLAYVRLARGDARAEREDQLADIGAIGESGGEPTFAVEQAEQLLDLGPETWDRVEREVPVVVAQTLRQRVTPSNLAVVRAGVISYVDRSMDNSTASLVAQVAGRFVQPNSRVDEEATAAALAAAREGAAPVERTIEAGTTIVREGDLVNEDQLEALEALGLLRGQSGWREALALAVLVTGLIATTAASLQRLQPGFWLRPRRVALVVLLILAFAVAARFAVPGQIVLSFVFPAATVAMTLTVLLGLETGLLAGLILGIVVSLLASSGLEPMAYVLLGSMAGSVVIGRAERLSSFAVAGAAITLADLAVLVAFRLPGPALDVQGMAELGGAALLNGALSAGLAAMGVVASGALFGVTTPLQLLELARPNHPLLRELQLKAPGSYHHSILVANLAESAAQAIGADALLVRVGAYYHDVGKTARPYFFVENQSPGANPHGGLDAHASAQIVIAHVPDGADMASRRGIPEAIIDFIWQHHGTTRVEYFYRQAHDLLGEELLDEAKFTYPGPRPQSRETAIVMLADGSEAAVRAANPDSDAEIERIVSAIIRSRLTSGQLDDSELTLRDLEVVRETFLSTLRSLYHPRIQYPADITVSATDGTKPEIHG